MAAKIGTVNAPTAQGGRPAGQTDARSLQDRLAALSRPTLGELADPTRLTGPIDIAGWPGETLRRMLESMIAIRATEERLARMVEDGDIVCPVHLAIGQEAAPVGVSHHLSAADRVFGAHRSHGHYLALGGDVYRLIAEALGRADGCSGGMGGSMHLFAPEIGFMGSVPIVAATVPIAVGAALAAKKDGGGAVAVSYFGDGAVEEGAVHESLNLASHMGLPVLFVCENNFYASHMDITQRQPSDRTARLAEAAGIEAIVVDGNSVTDVAAAAGRLIEAARRGDGPGYLEAVTYRWRGHVGPDENIDVGVRRSRSELEAWKRRDPVSRLARAMEERGDIADDEVARLQESIGARVAAAAKRALAAPYPAAEALLGHVYAGTKA
jgi:pyruvate dehydrogenase E1 component alpha subunit